jgi:hypothetical protein
LILIFSVNTNHESVAYRSFSPSKFEARGARKVTTGMDGYLLSSGYPPLSQIRQRRSLQDLVRLYGGQHTWMRGSPYRRQYHPTSDAQGYGKNLLSLG